jgi:Uma2 family endonuclease
MSVGQKSGVTRVRWTAKQFYRLLEKGFFRGRHLELVEGVIVQMAAQKDFHLASIDLTRNALQTAFGREYWVRAQGSLDLSPWTVLDPDIAVVAGDMQSHNLNQNPTSALLVVEVAGTTLGYDRHRKASIYARAGITDYWIVNLRNRELEVRRQPAPNAHPRYGHGYASLNTLGSSDFVTPLAAPQAKIAVADLLP